MTETEPTSWVLVEPVDVFPRPRGVRWARTGPLRPDCRGAWVCELQEHPVYLAVPPPGEGWGWQGNERARRVYVCAVCAPVPAPPGGPSEEVG